MCTSPNPQFGLILSSSGPLSASQDCDLGLQRARCCRLSSVLGNLSWTGPQFAHTLHSSDTGPCGGRAGVGGGASPPSPRSGSQRGFQGTGEAKWGQTHRHPWPLQSDWKQPPKPRGVAEIFPPHSGVRCYPRGMPRPSDGKRFSLEASPRETREREAAGDEPANLPAPGRVEFSAATGCPRAGSPLPPAGGRRSRRSEGRLGGGWGGSGRRREGKGSPKRPLAGGERGEVRGRASQRWPTQTLAPQPALLEAEDAHFGEDIHQVAVAEPAVLAGAAPPPAGRRPVPVLLPRLPLLADQAAGYGRGHGGPGNGSREGGDGGKGSRGRGRGKGRRRRRLALEEEWGGGQRGEERSRGAQSRLGPIALWAEHGAGRADAPGTRRGEPPEPRSRRPPPGRVRAGSGAGAVGAAAHPAPPKPCRGPPPPLAPPASLSRLPAGRSSPPTSRARDGGQVPAGGRRGRPSRADSEGLSAGLELSPGRCRRRRRPLAGSAGDCQVLWKSASGESNLLPGDL